MKVPDALPQLVPLPGPDGPDGRGRPTVYRLAGAGASPPTCGAVPPDADCWRAYAFRVTRDADIAIQELEADDLLETIEESVRQRRFGSAVRCSRQPRHARRDLRDLLAENLELDRRRMSTASRARWA